MIFKRSKLFKILLSIVFIFGLYSLINCVSAKTSFNKIKVDIELQDNGDANVTEIWDVNVDSGTELYHPYYNLGDSEIKDLEVIYKNEEYTVLSEWDVNQSRDNKAYKCGFHEIEDGIEICWGVSEYGKNQTYTVNYTITGFVAQLTDSQMIYWTIIPHDFSNTIKEAEINISANNLLPQTTEVWGYGKKGAPCYYKNGVIKMSAQNLKKNEYMTLLVKFPNKTFTTENELHKSFKYFYSMAQEDAEPYEDRGFSENTPNLKNTPEQRRKVFLQFTILYLLLLFVFFAPIFVYSRVYSRVSTKPGTLKMKVKYGPEGRRFKGGVKYYRDIPLNGDLYSAYFLCDVYKIVKNKNINIIGAFFLKWIKEKKIVLEPIKDGLLFKKNIYNAHLVYNESFQDPTEGELYSLFLRAAKDRILEKNEFKKWAKINYTTIDLWFKKAKVEGRERLFFDGLLTREKGGNRAHGVDKVFLSPQAKEEALKLAGLKKYLEEYTMIDEKTAPEVELFETYLIYAQIFGIADKVSEEFKSLYPDMIYNTNYYSYDMLSYLNTYSYLMTKTVFTTLSNSKMESMLKNIRDTLLNDGGGFSSGGGGFSSGGGGGGSFGGGGGGGGCR